MSSPYTTRAPRPAPLYSRGPQPISSTNAQAQGVPKAQRATLPTEERERFEAASPLRRPKASLGPRPAAPSMRPRPSSPTLEELNLQRSAQLQMSAELNKQTLYGLLNVEANCTDEELRRAYRLALSRFHPEGVATYGLYTRAQAIAITDQIEEAYLTLSDPYQRREYDSTTFPQGLPVQSREEELEQVRSRFKALVSPEAVEALLRECDAQPLSGEFLKRLRLTHNVTLDQLHERTKISLRNLASIEDEAVESLPADVYVRGYLQELARVYGLPETRLCADYLKLIHMRRGQR